MSALDVLAAGLIGVAFTIRLTYRKWIYRNSPEVTEQSADET